MLKAIDNTGMMGMLTGEQNESFNKLFDVINKLKTTDTTNKDELADLFKNELGIDMEKVNDQMSKLLNKDNTN
jgi:hypothetical protein